MKTGVLFRRGILLGFLLPGALFAAGCMHGMGGMHERMARPWPTIRLDGPAGARVVMERGVFGEGLDVRVPFQGAFQPTGDHVLTGYPLEIELDAVAAQHYGAAVGTKIYGRMTVGESARKRGVQVLAPSECALKALIAGDLDELRVTADELPRADVACARAQDMHAQAAHEDGACAMMCGHEGAAGEHGGRAGMHGGCPLGAGGHGMGRHGMGAHDMGAHGMGGQGMCAHGMGAHGACKHGMGGPFHHGAPATLVLRVTKF